MNCVVVLDMDVIRHVEASSSSVVGDCFARASIRLLRRTNTRSEVAYPCGTVQYYTVNEIASSEGPLQRATILATGTIWDII